MPFLTHTIPPPFSPWRDVWIRAGWRVQLHSRTGAARLRDPSGHTTPYPDQAAAQSSAEQCAPRPTARRGVVLLHGLMNEPGIMRPLQTMAQAQGWSTANLYYPTRSLSPAHHAAAASAAAHALAQAGAAEIAFIGHSLGGLIARLAIDRAAADGWRPGTLILIGSPARGSAVAQTLQHLPGYAAIIGACAHLVLPAGAQQVPEPGVKTLVIAGGTGGRGYNPFLRGDNDGLIAVAETQLNAPHESLLIRARHHALTLQRETILACSRCLGSA